MVGRQPCRVLHRSAWARRNEGNDALLPSAFAITAAGLDFVRSWPCQKFGDVRFCAAVGGQGHQTSVIRLRRYEYTT
jgi:hypothetical protein